MPGHIGKKTNRHRDVIGSATQAEREDQFGEMPGEVVSFDPKTQTGKMKPLYKKRLNGKATALPELEEVLVRFPRGGGGAITHPVKPGDKVSLRPMGRNMDNYHEKDGEFEAADTRSSSLSDMEAHIAGGESLSDPIPNFDPDNMHIRFDPEGKFGIRGSAGGKIKIEGSEGNIYALVHQAVDLCGDGFELLSSEPALIHTGEYSAIAAQLHEIAGKLAAMAL